jgi:hypothetical protein
MKTVRVNDGIIVEVLTAPSGFSLSACFHPDILAHCVEVPDEAQVGDTYTPAVVEEASVVVETPVTEEAPPEAPAEGV